LFISNTTDFYSTKLAKIDEVTFKIEYYDNSKGENFEDVFKWDGNEFIKKDGFE
jgi:bla regulator protein BlaR1